MFLTTDSLIQFLKPGQPGSSQIHLDDTQGMSAEHLAVIIPGFSDTARQFHAVGVALTSTKKKANFSFACQGNKTLRPDLLVTACLSDAAEAISNGARAVYNDDIEHALCWPHVHIKNVVAVCVFRCIQCQSRSLINYAEIWHPYVLRSCVHS